MYYKIELKNSSITLGLLQDKQEKAQLFLFQWYYQKYGTRTITHKLTIGIQYVNKRAKILTHRHKTIKELIS
ncbi:hypothetical protein BXU01_23040 [[Flexibacter] sp. ATCC 35103]|nr:hypothetical protein BXU01_23040 [[Flexibacter] sp. ATCC 35103]